MTDVAAILSVMAVAVITSAALHLPIAWGIALTIIGFCFTLASILGAEPPP